MIRCLIAIKINLDEWNRSVGYDRTDRIGQSLVRQVSRIYTNFNTHPYKKINENLLFAVLTTKVVKL